MNLKFFTLVFGALLMAAEIGASTVVAKNTMMKVHTLEPTPQLVSLMTMIRDMNVSRDDFIFYSDRIIRLLIEYALNLLPTTPRSVNTPTGAKYAGLSFGDNGICGVSIMRAGESMEKALRDVCRGVRIGKILIQRDEATALPKLYYKKLPRDISNRYVLLLDPMLATGGTAILAIDELVKDAQVRPDRILFVNLIASPEGLEAVTTAYPQVRIVTAHIDEGMNAQKYIMPGLGDFGCRYFGTDERSKL